MIFSARHTLICLLALVVASSHLIGQPPPEPMYLYPTLVGDSSRTVGPSQPILFGGDSLESKEVDGRIQRNLLGRVSMTQGNVTITCDRANHDPISNSAIFTGRVRVQQGEMSMIAPQLTYNGNSTISHSWGGVTLIDQSTRITADEVYYSTTSRLANFFGHVRVSDDSSTMYADTLVHDRNSEVSFGTGHCILLTIDGKSLAESDTIFDDKKKGFTRLTGNPHVFLLDSTGLDTIAIDTTAKIHGSDSLSITTERDSGVLEKQAKSKVKAIVKKPRRKSEKKENETLPKSDSSRSSPAVVTVFDTMCIAADTIESTRGEREHYELRGRCSSYRNNFSSRSEFMSYSSELISLLHNPIAWFDSTQLTGDTLIVETKEKKLNRIRAKTKGVALTRSDTSYPERINQLLGKELLIHVSRDTVQLIESFGSAKSLYYVYKEEEPDGASRFLSDSIRIHFDKGEIERVVYINSVGGDYLPENLAMVRGAALRFEGTSWRIDRPRLRPRRFILSHDIVLDLPSQSQAK